MHIFKTKIEKKLRKRLENLPCYNEDKVYKTKLEILEDIVYLKLYYEGNIDYPDVEKVYTSSISLFIKEGFVFQDICEYHDNHEICLTFLKKN